MNQSIHPCPILSYYPCIHPSIQPAILLSIHQVINPSIHPFLYHLSHLSVCSSSNHPSIYLISGHLSVCPSIIWQFIYPTVHLFHSISSIFDYFIPFIPFICQSMVSNPIHLKKPTPQENQTIENSSLTHSNHFRAL